MSGKSENYAIIFQKEREIMNIHENIKEEEIIPALKKAIEFDGPTMIDFICENFEMVFPWVLAGQPIDKVLLSREEE